MIVRLESRPAATSPFEVLFNRSSVFPGLNWQNGFTQGDEYPYVNIADMGDALHMVAEVPGIAKSDIDIKLLGDVLTVSGSRKEPEIPKGATSVRQEITYGAFERSFKLPYEVDSAKVSAEYRDGILRVVLPKIEAAKPKAIVIQ